MRTIHPSAREAVLEFLESSLCRRLQQRRDVIDAIVDDSGSALRLLHPRIQVPAYPWEWTPSQWVAAGELTLRLCEEALADGWILKDATPLNILFPGPDPMLVDILSFERRVPGASIWLAYGQYVRTFLLPLLMHKLLAWPLALSLFRRDGLEPSDLFRAIGWGKRLSRDVFWPVTLPALLERQGGGGAAKALRQGSDPGLETHILKKSLNDLRRRTRRAQPATKVSAWSEYKGTLAHYTAEESARKVAWVQEVLQELRPRRVLDIGANTGEFSILSAEAGAEVVALERDAMSAEKIFRESRERKLAIQTIHADLARPTPAVGWENDESSALLGRLDGQFDLVLMLAVIHHLILMEQIPLDRIMALCHRLTRGHLLVEWVPVEDPMYQSLMRGRAELYAGLSERDLVNACAERFTMVRRERLGNGRILFLLEKS